MGKARKGRRKMHAPAPAPAVSTPAPASAERLLTTSMDKGDGMSVGSMKKAGSVSPSKASKAAANPFRGMKINTESLKQALPDFDSQSAITNKQFKDLNLKKKDKRQLRHDIWMEKIDTIQQERKKKKAKRKREKTAVVGDMQMLAEALPVLELLQKETPASVVAREKTAKKKGIATEKQRQKEMLNDIQLFQQVLTIPEYKAKPAETILEHLRNKMQKEEEEMDT